MARCLCGRKCFRHLSGCEMATLAAYDPGHGLYPWSRMKEHPPIHNCHTSEKFSFRLLSIQFESKPL